MRKKNGKLRLVIDARRANFLTKRPPKTELASSAAFVELISHEHDVDDDGWHTYSFVDDEDPNPKHDSLFFSCQDVADCFYQFSIPPELQAIFALKNLRAKEVNVSEIDGER